MTDASPMAESQGGSPQIKKFGMSLRFVIATLVAINAVQLGTVDLEDYDRFVPFLALTVRGVSKKLLFVTIFNNSTQNFVGVGFLGPPDVPAFGYLVANKTCQFFCPVTTTNTSAVYYRLQQTTNGAFSLGGVIARTAPGVQAWKRSWWSAVDRAPPNTISISNPTLAVGNSIVPIVLAQYMSFPIWDSQGNFVAGAAIMFASAELSSQLDLLKAKATPNSLFYIVAPTGQMLGMSGLNASLTISPLIYRDAANNWALKTIWDFSLDDYPLTNISASTVLSYSGLNLSSDFEDANFRKSGYFFQVTSYRQANFKWIIVSGAPMADYIANSLELQTKLSDDLNMTNRNIIIISACIVIAMSFCSALLAEVTILRPFHYMLQVMAKATKFDFSMIKDKSLNANTDARTIISDVRVLQERFVEMLLVFANAVKQNKSLANRTVSSVPRPSISAAKESAAVVVEGASSMQNVGRLGQ
ncbi:hypothetical protein M427DRAFT_39891 [Gonapodya prolifera JEL478]|uniref:Uncharacterized protein n=1 Tax=Gonapodya prolifera (strain JEL478) TaxID=1344416 RepID=A0A138ZWH6_GONPJ|nr:hypothetical protein M427DRAFT_39891 [Gonapodya prolifera JEL478]|eukprot:KXS08846.1 hypothetical protein M427DRAFT_39891 [Gonapodya prolifera JEL478]